MKGFRNSAKAIIVRGGKLLVMKARDRRGDYYLLPGGGQKFRETIAQALVRECREELSAEISVGPLRLVREYIGRNHEFAKWDRNFHQVELMFECRLKNARLLKTGSRPDSRQTGWQWLELKNISRFRLYPAALKTALGKTGRISAPVYLGDVN